MARKTFRFRKKKKYQRHNKTSNKRNKKQETRKGKGFLSRLLSRKKKRKVTYYDDANEIRDQLATYLAHRQTKYSQPAYITIYDLKNEQKKK